MGRMKNNILDYFTLIGTREEVGHRDKEKKSK
jgi:hypothetical protein